MTKEQEVELNKLCTYLNYAKTDNLEEFIVSTKTVEAVLNMLKEKDQEIENKKKSLDNLENELNRLSERNLELFEESFEAQKKNEYWESRIKQGKKDVKGLKLYEIGIVCEDLKEEIEKKDKIIDLMAEDWFFKEGHKLQIYIQRNRTDDRIFRKKRIYNQSI